MDVGIYKSHPSVKFPVTSYLADDPRTVDIYAKLTEIQSSIRLGTEREDIVPIAGYFDDMFLALKEQWRVLKPGGILFYVVANSRHQYLPVATDVILGAIATRIGFEPLELIILKKRNGRTRQKKY